MRASVQLLLKLFFEHFDQSKVTHLENKYNVKISKYDQRGGLFEVVNFRKLGPSDIKQLQDVHDTVIELIKIENDLRKIHGVPEQKAEQDVSKESQDVSKEEASVQEVVHEKVEEQKEHPQEDHKADHKEDVKPVEKEIPEFPFSWTDEFRCLASDVLPKVWPHHELREPDVYGNTLDLAVEPSTRVKDSIGVLVPSKDALHKWSAMYDELLKEAF